MADRVFCIDFGSAFTKVALRRDPSATSELVNNPTRRAEEVDFCVPSIALVDRTGPEPRAEFGPANAGRRPGNGIELHPNWKRHLFAGVSRAGESNLPPLDALLQSEQLRQLAEQFGVDPSQIGHLQRLVVHARGLLGIEPIRASSSEARWRSFGAALAYWFFRWLRQYIMDACTHIRAAGLNPEAIPVRITVPAFAHGRGIETHPGCLALTNALSRSGWPLDPDRPIISEPYTNAIGILTQGVNIVHKGRAQLRRMFRDGPIMRPLASPKDHPAYRAWSIDVGAFTTDFTAITLDPKGETVVEPEDALRVAQRSIPIGIRGLDERVLAVLPGEQQDWLQNHARPLDWEDFRNRVYSQGRALMTAEVGAIGGADRRAAIDRVVCDFGRELADACVAFRSELPPVKLQELMLTGGGNMIPAVHEALTTSMQSGGECFVHVYTPAGGRRAGPDPARRLDVNLARGGSALGGTSAYFEPQFS